MERAVALIGIRVDWTYGLPACCLLLSHGIRLCSLALLHDAGTQKRFRRAQYLCTDTDLDFNLPAGQRLATNFRKATHSNDSIHESWLLSWRQVMFKIRISAKRWDATTFCLIMNWHLWFVMLNSCFKYSILYIFLHIVYWNYVVRTLNKYSKKVAVVTRDKAM